jgi:hypothetical protein
MTGPATDCARCGGAGWVWLHATAPRSVVRAVEASCPDCCGPSPSSVLDWREAHHWSSRELPCRHCGGLTNLRDDDRRPAHKTCAETAAGTPDAAERSRNAR